MLLRSVVGGGGGMTTAALSPGPRLHANRDWCRRLPGGSSAFPPHRGCGTDPGKGGAPADSDGSGQPSEAPAESPPLPPDLQPPTNCCMRGCPNCVWVEYADRLQQHCGDGGARALAALEQRVADEGLRAFLRVEMRLRAARAPEPSAPAPAPLPKARTGGTRE
ncbi:oxidoreductase-like domain-containing protein 1 [Erinaceus europaeus]|uniref:Oxidoreductase-like domain-containing protein 1 n=1 Tax=Erinaceus europaeus TaxID=9365 RepID=A0ABM3VTW8_ERIEU|nr:oxidoreductase-like domain-containing protein 1 [Erinaceus europaeus]